MFGASRRAEVERQKKGEEKRRKEEEKRKKEEEKRRKEEENRERERLREEERKKKEAEEAKKRSQAAADVMAKVQRSQWCPPAASNTSILDIQRSEREQIYNFQGLMAPVFTPFQSNIRQDLTTSYIGNYATILMKMGIKAILVNGTTGEGVSMSITERKAIAAAWAMAVKITKQNLMVQVGGCSIRDVQDLARHADDLQVSSILCLPDLFFKPKTVEELVDYMKVVASAAPRTPCFYYHIPAFTGVNIPMPQFLAEAVNQIPTFSGIKFTSNDLDEGAKCLAVNEDLTIFLGADTLYAPALTLGFDSFIMTTLNFWPQRFRDIDDFLANGKIADANRLQSKISNDIMSILGGDGTTKAWVRRMKSYMNDTLGHPVGDCR